MGIAVRSVGKLLGDPPARILADITLDIADGEFLALTGRSGAGKSSLLYIISSLDAASEGAVAVDGRDLGLMDAGAVSAFRNREVGFVFQFHYLLAELSALDNVLMPARKTAQEAGRRRYALELLERFGLSDKRERLPRQLSGGELQRLAIARALVMEPRYLFADEPTGSLDTANGDLVLEILRGESRKGTTVVMVTHDTAYAALADRQVRLADGRLT